jgi:hypothetical protein
MAVLRVPYRDPFRKYLVLGYNTTDTFNGIKDVGEDISQLNDDSPYGNNATQETANDQPSYNTTNKSIEFDGSIDYMNINSPVTFLDGEPFTILCKVANAGVASFNRMVFGNSDLLTENYYGITYNTTTFSHYLRFDNGTQIILADATYTGYSGENVIVAATCDGTDDSNNVQGYINGVQHAQGSITDNEITFDLLGRGYEVGREWQGEIYTVLIYNKCLPETEINQVIDYYNLR